VNFWTCAQVLVPCSLLLQNSLRRGTARRMDGSSTLRRFLSTLTIRGRPLLIRVFSKNKESFSRSRRARWPYCCIGLILVPRYLEGTLLVLAEYPYKNWSARIVRVLRNLLSVDEPSIRRAVPPRSEFEQQGSSRGPILSAWSRIHGYDKFPVVRVTDSSESCASDGKTVGAD